MTSDNMTCTNCGGESHELHYDLCCLCFSIAFGEADHAEEHANPVRRRHDSPYTSVQAADEMPEADFYGEC